MTRKPRAREKVPVLGSDGRTSLGDCEVLKYPRAAGLPLKEILATDLEGNLVAEVFVYVRHSLVRSGSAETVVPPIDSTAAVEVVRTALEAAGDGPEAILDAVAKALERLLTLGVLGLDSE